MNRQLLLGIDGGGTTTIAKLAELTPAGEIHILASDTSGPSNAHVVGHERAIRTLDEVVIGAIRQAGVDQTLDSAVIGLAGSAFSDIGSRVQRWAAGRELAIRVELVNDIQPVVAAGIPENRGVALIVGTGTAAIGVTPDGASLLVGGWGHWFGDQGSGFDLGRQALIAACRYFDGIGEPTVLLDSLLSHFELENPRGILSRMEDSGNVRTEIAALAKLVLESSAHDEVAMSIVTRAVDEVTGLVEAVAKRLSFDGDFSLAVAGSVICESRTYRDRFAASLKKKNIVTEDFVLVTEPVDGCLILAKKILATGA